MFLPDVTKSRSSTTFAPVVSPTSCLIEPRDSTLSDITASGSAGAAEATACVANSHNTAGSTRKSHRVRRQRSPARELAVTSVPRGTSIRLDRGGPAPDRTRLVASAGSTDVRLAADGGGRHAGVHESPCALSN